MTRGCYNCGNHLRETPSGYAACVFCCPTEDKSYATMWIPKEEKDCNKCNDMNCNTCERGN